MKTLVVLIGPTGVGKTELSLSLAEHLQCPILNADSRQIFKDIEIGTAAPTADELARVKHYFVHTLPLDSYYSAAQYEEDVLKILGEVFAEGDVAIMSGGSMMYVDAVTKGIDDIPTVDDEVRSLIAHRLATEGLDPLLAELKILDPSYYEVVDHHNHKRVVHALEICYMSGATFISLRVNKVRERPFRIIKFGLMRERASLFSRINRRVDMMMQQGFMDEAQRVYHLRHLNSLNTVGYKELFNVIDGTWELPMAVERIKKNTRVYAKKQMTWYKRDEDIHWLNADTMNVDAMLQTICAELNT